MKKILLAAAAISGLALATPSSASPLASGMAMGSNTIPTVNEGLVQKVHGWHCRRKHSNRRGWHRHRRACDNYDYGFHGYPSYGYGLGVPFFSFGFSDFDGGRRHHHRWRKHGGKKHWD